MNNAKIHLNSHILAIKQTNKFLSDCQVLTGQQTLDAGTTHISK